jgi:hypothetical protein
MSYAFPDVPQRAADVEAGARDERAEPADGGRSPPPPTHTTPPDPVSRSPQGSHRLRGNIVTAQLSAGRGRQGPVWTRSSCGRT